MYTHTPTHTLYIYIKVYINLGTLRITCGGGGDDDGMGDHLEVKMEGSIF
jgi:hypothetical protein